MALVSSVDEVVTIHIEAWTAEFDKKGTETRPAGDFTAPKHGCVWGWLCTGIHVSQMYVMGVNMGHEVQF